MSGVNDGGPAFPAEGPSAGQFENHGMTLRDYFAAKAVQGLIAVIFKDVAQKYIDKTDRINPLFAKTAYEVADAMLEARK